MRSLLKSSMPFILVSNLVAQTPEITSWNLNTDGDLANYEYYEGRPEDGATAVNLNDSSEVKSVCYDDDNIYVRTDGLAGYTMGPFERNPNVPSSQDYTFEITRTPQEETGTKTSIPSTGVIGLASNGVVYYGYGDARSYSQAENDNVSNGDNVWFSDAWPAEGESMDATGGGHPTDRGAYHYHAIPFTLYSDAGTEHSPIIGYALDGFPIYGPFGYETALDDESSIIRMTSGYELRNISVRTTLPNGSTASSSGPAVSTEFPLGTYIEDYSFTGTGTLDEYNGRYCVTPEYPNGTYAYFLATDDLGEPAFPYILASEYYGQITQQAANQAGRATTPNGLTCYDGTITSIGSGDNIDIAIYPNPAKDRVKITSPKNIVKINLISSEGDKISTWAVNNKNYQFSTSDYSSGLYFVQVEYNDSTITYSLNIQ